MGIQNIYHLIIFSQVIFLTLQQNMKVLVLLYLVNVVMSSLPNDYDLSEKTPEDLLDEPRRLRPIGGLKPNRGGSKNDGSFIVFGVVAGIIFIICITIYAIRQRIKSQKQKKHAENAENVEENNREQSFSSYLCDTYTVCDLCL